MTETILYNNQKPDDGKFRTYYGGCCVEDREDATINYLTWEDHFVSETLKWDNNTPFKKIYEI